MIIAPGPVGTTILRMTRKTAGYGFAFDAGLAAGLNKRGTAAREIPASRAAVPKNPARGERSRPERDLWINPDLVDTRTS